MMQRPAFFVIATMQSWIEFLETQGARAIDPATGAIGAFGKAAAATPPASGFMVPLTGFGLIAARGADAASFLHNQLTNDVEKLGTDQARLAGYCTPKGRLLATLLVWKDAQSVLLQVPRALQPALQKRLQMFIMRAKATLQDVSATQVQIALVGAEVDTVLKTWFAHMPQQPYALVQATPANDADDTGIGFGSLIRLADTGDTGNAAAAGVPRYVWVLDVGCAIGVWPQLAAALQPAGVATWELASIRAAVPSVTAATQEQFVPQMINFEAVGGVNFQKGCYPGQEIVARSQYLGKLKRRMMPATVAAADVMPGMEVFADADPLQACGMVVNAAPSGAGVSTCLVEIKLAALDGGVHLGAADGPLLTFHALPYDLADADRPDLR
jgi:folate-binding protein YgfZ